MNPQTRSRLVVVLVLLAMAAGTFFYFHNKYTIDTKQGSDFSDIVAPDVFHQPVSLFEVQDNRLMLVQFWASWCGPCLRELPDLARIQKTYANAPFRNADGLGVFMFSLDHDTVKWQAAINRFKLQDMIHVNERAAFKSPTARRLNVNSIPTNVLLDPQRRVVGVDLDMKELEKLLRNFN